MATPKHRRRALTEERATGAGLSPRVLLVGGIALWVLLGVAAYWPSLAGQFVLDDDKLVIDNPLVHASDGLYRFWFTTEPADYWPLTSTTFWIEWRLWRLDPIGYHVVNLLLHIAAAVLIWKILHRLRLPGAFLAATLFLVHPVNVESVAWIAQRKNTLSMMFFLLSILLYLWADVTGQTKEDAKRRTGEQEIRGVGSNAVWYWLSLLAFVLAMLSKGSVAILPLVLLLLVWWQRRRIDAHDVLRTAPFFLVAIALAEVNVWFQTHGETIMVRDAGVAERLAGAGAAMWFYLSKAMLPIGLVFVYPMWNIAITNALWWLPLLAAAAVTFVLWRGRENKFARSTLAAWIFFCVALLPVLGFTDVGFMRFSLVADHYQQIALVGVAALVAGGWSAWSSKSSGAAKTAGVVVVCGLALLTWNQSRIYADPITLYSATLIDNPDCWMAHYNLAKVFSGAGRNEEAIEHYRAALRLNPNYVESLSSLGIALAATGQEQEAMQCLQKSLALRHNSALAQNNMGLVLLLLDRPQEAAKYLADAVQQKPEYADAHLNLANALMALGQKEAAIEQLNKVLQYDPDSAEAQVSFGHILLTMGQTEKAVEHLARAVELNPRDAAAHLNLGGALVALHRTQEAIDQFELALRYNPNSAEAHFDLGSVLANAGRLEEAIEQYRQAVRIKPTYTQAHFILAIALMNAERREEAIESAQQALELARSQNQTALTTKIEEWLTKHRGEQKPRRDKEQ